MTTTTLRNALTFDAALARVEERAAAMLPDAVVRTADLHMTPEGHLVAAGMPRVRLNDHARAQLGSLLGIRWEKWFAAATEAERADEVTRRLARQPGELKVRAWRDLSGEAEGLARALVAPSFTPIDDARVFRQMATMLKGLVNEYRFHLHFTDTTTHYSAVHMDEWDLGGGDLLHPGWHLRNSEVGASALSLDDYWLRLVCSNGMMARVGNKRSLYRTHRAIDDDALAAALLLAIGRLPERWKVSFALMQAARGVRLPHPEAAVAAALGDSAEVPRALLKAAQQAVLRDGDFSRFGVVQAITLVAHTCTNDRDVRFAMERLAGDYLTATAAVLAPDAPGVALAVA